MTLMLGLDPGPERSALVGLNADGPTALRILDENAVIRAKLEELEADEVWGYRILAIEIPQPHRDFTPQSAIDTAVEAGRFIQVWRGPCRKIKRTDVKHHLYPHHKTKKHPDVPGADAGIRAVLLKRFGPKGTKASPGPMYGYKADLWQALAVAVCAAETREKGKP